MVSSRPAPAPLLLTRDGANWSSNTPALSYIEPQKIRFRYRLEGYDPDWIDGGRVARSITRI